MRRILWGTLLLAGAVLIILSSLNVELGFIGLLSVSDLILGAVIIAIGACLAYDRMWSALPFVAAVLFFVFESEIAASLGRDSDNILNNWVVIVCAALASIGISFITSPVKERKFKKKEEYGKYSSATRFANDVKYFDCAKFTKYYYKLSMSNGEICFENTDQYAGDGILTVNCKMSNLVINVPSDWCVESQIVNKLGEVNVPASANPSGPRFVIDGESNMSTIEVRYF